MVAGEHAMPMLSSPHNTLPKPLQTQAELALPFRLSANHKEHLDEMTKIPFDYPTFFWRMHRWW